MPIPRMNTDTTPQSAMVQSLVRLLACFVGLGLGYALAMRDRIALVIVLPMLALQFAFMTIVRYGSNIGMRTELFSEQLSMGAGVGDLTHRIFLYALLAIVFLITA